jgi:hypothetical protein
MASGGDLDSPDVEILRDDLAAILFAASGPEIEYLFDDAIAVLDQDADGVRVVFQSGGTRTFDLVVGATECTRPHGGSPLDRRRTSSGTWGATSACGPCRTNSAWTAGRSSTR